MQHYLHYGFGFSSDLLTKEEFERLQNPIREHDLEKNPVGIQLVAFTEGEPEHSWSTVILRDLGEVGDAGKFATLKEMTDFFEHKKIATHQAEYLAILTHYGIERLFDNIEPIVYSDNY